MAQISGLTSVSMTVFLELGIGLRCIVPLLLVSMIELSPENFSVEESY
ncbi:hypothetical protein NHE_0110 [Neorickettsia helminthoeca str. Oregon]|uniref:Uncharacterized protein n=1 Tax=Neorickettsia helminthoeca str. Oregon TaxID=1286528 RepID=X5HL56_9RICK|nr:hypothetical protein NHE_0110 [Neorickettsia helminthoeca str. Oregon]